MSLMNILVLQIAGIALAVAPLAFCFMPVGLWVSALAAGVPVGPGTATLARNSRPIKRKPMSRWGLPGPRPRNGERWVMAVAQEQGTSALAQQRNSAAVMECW